MRRLPLTQGMHMNDSKNTHKGRSIAQKAVAVLVCLAMASLQMPLVGSAFAEGANGAAAEQPATTSEAAGTDTQTQPAASEADEDDSTAGKQEEQPASSTAAEDEAAPAAAAKSAPLRAPQAPAADAFPSAPPTSTFEESAFNKLPGGKLGVLANFGLVGFESINGKTHINSNVATETFYANTFGTNNLAEPEVSYIGTKVVGGANVNMKDGGGKYNGSAVVLGSDSKVEVIGDNPNSMRQVKVDGEFFNIKDRKSVV